MDWNRTQTIFIAVFLVLNVFLYSLYLNKVNEAQNVEVPAEKTIESRLKEDDIQYAVLPNTVDAVAYISGRVRTFVKEDFVFPNQKIKIVNGTDIVSNFIAPKKLRNMNEDASFTEFVSTHVLGGSSYKLWGVNREEKYAIFFQHMNGQTIYYNQNGFVKVYWNEDDEVYKYEQTMLESLKTFEQQENILPPIQVIQTLYSKGLLKPNSHITYMKLGYSTLVQLTETQVFAPTWEVRVKHNSEENEFFVNAVEGKVVDIKKDVTIIEDEQ